MRQLKPNEVLQIVTTVIGDFQIIIDLNNNEITNRYIVDQLQEQYPDEYDKIKTDMIQKSRLTEKKW